MKRYPKILFFVNGVMPSAEAQEIAQELGPNVCFRNANFVPSSGAPEKCDGVAGEVPELYKEFPDAEEVIEKFEEERKASIAAAKEKQVQVLKDKQEAEAKAKADAEAKAKDDAEKAKAAEAKKATTAASKQTATAKKPADWKPNA